MELKGNLSVKIVTHVILMVMSLLAIVPFLLLIVSSFTLQDEILVKGYSLFPQQFSLEAYQYLWRQRDQIFNAYGITVIVTLIGTVVNVLLTTLLAYPLSRPDLPGRKVMTFLVFFTMLFNGGLVPTYLIYTTYFSIKNTLAALLVPSLLMSSWYVLLCKSYFVNSIPSAVLESARIDGANDFVIYHKIILPLGKPIIATVTLFAGIAYWNDWYNGMIYLTDHKLFSIQNLFYRMLSDIQYMSNIAQMGGQVDDLATQIPSTTVRMAIAVIGFLPIVIIYPFVQKNFVKGIAVGAVKG